MSLGKLSYSKRWNGNQHAPIDPISEDAARKLDSRGKPYVVTVHGDNAPEKLISINWSLDHCAVWFLDEHHRRYLEYGFRKVKPETLFLSAVCVWEYPPGATRDYSSATRITKVTYQQDQIAHERVTDTEAGTVDTISRSDVPLDINWEPVPVFGDWTRLSRYNREE